MKLVLAELCEGLVPLSYAFCFSMAYYGPNSRLIGNVGTSLWQYKATDDASRTLIVLFALFFMDLISLSLNATLIWIHANVNIIQKICGVLQEYWIAMAIVLATSNFMGFFSNDINLGMDMTFQFCWILREKQFNCIYNSTNIE